MLCLICLKLQIPLEGLVEKKTGLQVKFGLNFFENLKIKAKYLRSLKPFHGIVNKLSKAV